MDKRTAERLMQNLMELGGPLNSATELTHEISDEEERKLIRSGIGTVMLDVIEVMKPIIQQYPELDPDRKNK